MTAAERLNRYTLKFFHSTDGLNFRCIDLVAGKALLSCVEARKENFYGERCYQLSNGLGHLEMRVGRGVDWAAVKVGWPYV